MTEDMFMDLLMSVMSTGTCFVREHLCRYHGLDEKNTKAGSVKCHGYYTQIHATSFPMQPNWLKIIAEHDRVLVPVRDPMRSLLTGVAKNNPMNSQIQRVRGWRGVLEVWDDWKFYPLPTDMDNHKLRDAMWSLVFMDLEIDWERKINHTPPAPHVEKQIEAYEARGTMPYLPDAVLGEWELARDDIQRFFERLGYQPLPWWR